MAGKGAHTLASGWLPQSYRVVVASGGKQMIVWAERHIPDPAGVAGESTDWV